MHSALVNAPRCLQRSGIRTQTPNRRLPHPLWRRIENQIAIDIADEPCRSLELRLELARRPPGITDDETRARRRTRLEQAPQQVGRGRQIQRVRDLHAARFFVIVRLVADEYPASLRLHRTA